MDRNLLQKYLNMYIEHFDYIHHQEEYKWRAVKVFQERWNLQEEDMHTMLFESVKGVENLLTSRNFFPLDNLSLFAKHEPENLKSAFRKLLYGDYSISQRIESFKKECVRFLQTVKEENKRFNYNGSRSSMVFLAMAFPERHFLYKFTMYREFCKLFALPVPKKGASSNVANYESLCIELRDLLAQNKLLVALHNSVLGKDHFQDMRLHIRTQDFIYACVEHLPKLTQAKSDEVIYGLSENDFSNGQIRVKKKVYESFKGLAKENEKSKKDKELGNYGENLVYKYLLKKYDGIANVIAHFKEDDSKGFDIGVEQNGIEIKRIEVKTTKGKLKTPFFISGNQLNVSQQDPDKYELWRIYNLNPKTGRAKCHIIPGSLENLCTNPVKYEVELITR